jgi:hypothetical protein
MPALDCWCVMRQLNGHDVYVHNYVLGITVTVTTRSLLRAYDIAKALNRIYHEG